MEVVGIDGPAAHRIVDLDLKLGPVGLRVAFDLVNDLVDEFLDVDAALLDRDGACETQQVVHQFMDRQYRETLDQPVGMLGNKTPRQAAKSAAGRQKVAEWLKYLENQSAKQAGPTDPMATYSFEWMWKELGVHDLRR